MAGWTADDNNLNTTLVLAQMSVFYVCVCVCVCVYVCFLYGSYFKFKFFQVLLAL